MCVEGFQPILDVVLLVYLLKEWVFVDIRVRDGGRIKVLTLVYEAL